jgi:hypothetical protein
MNLYAAAILIPVGVMFYTAHGGLRASYLAAWANTGTIFIALNIVSAHALLLGKKTRTAQRPQPSCTHGPWPADVGSASRRCERRCFCPCRFPPPACLPGPPPPPSLCHVYP